MATGGQVLAGNLHGVSVKKEPSMSRPTWHQHIQQLSSRPTIYDNDLEKRHRVVFVLYHLFTFYCYVTKSSSIVINNNCIAYLLFKLEI